MSAEVEMSVDTKPFEEALVKFKVATGKSWPEVIKMQARLLIARLIEWTPPQGAGKDAQKKQQTKIEGDIRRVFTDFGEFKFRNLGIQKAWDEGNKTALEQIFKDSPKLAKYELLAKPVAALHEQARFVGKVPKRHRPKYVIMGGRRSTGGQELMRYIKSVQNRAGKAKSGWIGAARWLTAKFPAWISRSGGAALGGVNDKTRDVLNPSITMNNRVGYIGAIFPDFKLQQLLNTRVRDMVANMKKYTEAAARKAGF